MRGKEAKIANVHVQLFQAYTYLSEKKKFPFFYIEGNRGDKKFLIARRVILY